MRIVRNIWRYVQTIAGLIFRHPIAGVSIIPVMADGRIVLVRRQDNGLWGLPGGFIDWGEDIASAVVRELREETGLSLVKIVRLVGVYSAPDRDPRIHSICFSVEALVTGDIQIEDDLEVSEGQPFRLEELPLTNLSHDHERQLKDYLSGQTVVA